MTTVSIVSDTDLHNARAQASGQRISDAVGTGMTLDQAVMAERARKAAQVAEAIVEGGFDLSPAFQPGRYAYTIVAGAGRIEVARITTTHRGLVAFPITDYPYGTIAGYPGVDDVIADRDAGATIMARLAAMEA